MTIVVLEAEVDLEYVQETGQNISEAVMDEVSYVPLSLSSHSSLCTGTILV